jgi:bleomycin hydrolase
MNRIGVFSLVFILLTTVSAQKVRKDNGMFRESRNEFWDYIEKETKEFRTEPKEPETEFVMDFSGMDLPVSLNDFKYQWHNPPIPQANTNTCWSFSTTSFFESEIYRLSNRQIKVSEMYTVYWEYVEKAQRFVRTHGKSYFAEGSEANAVKRIWKEYGAVPEELYTGMRAGQKLHDHTEMFKEMKNYLDAMVKVNFWEEDEILANIKSIMNYYMGEPPLVVKIENRDLTPIEYVREFLKMNMDDYVDFLSIKQQPYYQQVEFEVPDNWWHNEEYFNIPLDEFMNIIKRAVRADYTICIGGDVSESGYDSRTQAAMIPSFDIPSAYIDENARQLRFSNKTTEDDHGIHMVGYTQKENGDWFLIKDSGSGARNGKNKGYRFYHEDFVKLKMLGFMIHRGAVEEVLNKFAENRVKE